MENSVLDSLRARPVAAKSRHFKVKVPEPDKQEPVDLMVEIIDKREEERLDRRDLLRRIESKRMVREEITDDTKEIATSSGTPKKENSGYSLVGPNMIPEHNETALTLRKLLETEQRERRSAESQAEMMRTQIDMMREVIHELKSEIEIVRDHAQNYEVERNQYEKEASKYKTDNINRANIEECEVLEKELRSTLETIESRKANLIAEKARIDNMDDRRLCVICCEKEKSIVLLPCRHMCLCEDCSEHDDLLQCPLCRRQIAHKFSVFA